jgi:hypothetical protein
MNNVKIILAFLVGAASGAFATYRFLDKKYEARADEEIESIREFANKRIKEIEARAQDEQNDEPATVVKRRTKADNNYTHTYTDYNSIYKSKEPLSSVAECYIIMKNLWRCNIHLMTARLKTIMNRNQLMVMVIFFRTQ